MAIKGACGSDSDGVSESRPATPRESNMCEDVAILSRSRETGLLKTVGG